MPDIVAQPRFGRRSGGEHAELVALRVRHDRPWALDRRLGQQGRTSRLHVLRGADDIPVDPVLDRLRLWHRSEGPGLERRPLYAIEPDPALLDVSAHVGT